MFVDAAENDKNKRFKEYLTWNGRQRLQAAQLQITRNKYILRLSPLIATSIQRMYPS